ncbi:hypothetical protein FOZG_06165 [Fusarium oxysporum Fo47]|uniref:Zn(2)-C6 fungal-type domain-containing protein n=1 Tax=Fusarium oxysporum Fo47 TaxID=660027 RepID=W9KV97_FUSOX|nr:hypothetical protein FOZG_06165 [Fusarium oxysporum Fo47]EWZ45961.1 hypothetical protein FOZG_06165 [Fusarium oxysporum Fo47]
MNLYTASESKRPSSGSGSQDDTVAAKLRRAHRKSRKGCWECKRRHIKCDESRPACGNCAVSERSCSFPSSATPATTTPTASPIPFHPLPLLQAIPNNASNNQVQSCADSCSDASAIQIPQSAGRPPSCSRGRVGFPEVTDDLIPFPTTFPSFTDTLAVTTFVDSSSPATIPSGLPQPIFTAKHLSLLHHAITDMPLAGSFIGLVVDIALKWCHVAPYAMDQLLALSADHLGLLSPENATSHRRTATELQTRALMWFNRPPPELMNRGGSDPNKTCVPRFLFASLLSLQILYETFTHYRANFHVFIERFLELAHLHRGVRTVTSSMYDTILESSIGPFLLNIRNAEEAAKHGGSECVELISLIRASDLGPTAVTGCLRAARTLQWAFNIHANLPLEDNVHAATAFPVLLTADFLDTVRKQQPEALIIMAYYGVLLHRCRESWFIDDAGTFLVRLIADYLGSFWQEPMRWPLEEVAREQG